MAKYLRKDYENGYMSDATLIEYYKKVQEIDIINNLLIGDYNNKGEYEENSYDEIEFVEE